MNSKSINENRNKSIRAGEAAYKCLGEKPIDQKEHRYFNISSSNFKDGSLFLPMPDMHMKQPYKNAQAPDLRAAKNCSFHVNSLKGASTREASTKQASSGKDFQAGD